MDVRFTESTFSTLSSEDYYLAAHAVIPHSEVVATELAFFVRWDEACLSEWSPDVV